MSYSPLFLQCLTQYLYVLKKKKKKKKNDTQKNTNACFNKLQFLASNPKETNKQKIMYYWVGQKVGLGFLYNVMEKPQYKLFGQLKYLFLSSSYLRSHQKYGENLLSGFFLCITRLTHFRDLLC